MTKRVRTIYLGAFLVALAGVTYALTGRLAFPSGNAAIWFNSGLLMIAIGAYWIEPYFTKPSDVAINALVVFVSVSSLNNPPLPEWWMAVRYLSLGLMLAALLLVWSNEPLPFEQADAWIRRLSYHIVVRLGSARVLFSIVFILALISYFDLHQASVRWAVVLWGILLSAKYLDLDGLLSLALGSKDAHTKNIVGRLSRLASPNIVRFTLFRQAECPRGSYVAFSDSGAPDTASPVAFVIGHRVTPELVEAEAILVGSGFIEGKLDTRQLVSVVTSADEVLTGHMKQSALDKRIDNLVGFASRGSDIARLYFEIVRPATLEEGHLVAVPLDNRKELLFQVINGKLHEEVDLENSERTFTIGEAEQLGTWNESRHGFETHSWVVPENAPVIHIIEQVQSAAREEVVGIVEVGHVPSSKFPINISIRDLVLYHSAILGVTGSGKSFLAYHLIENCAKSGVKILCLDITGDYKRYLRDPEPVMLRKTSDIDAFLRSDSAIGIVEFTEEKIHPIVATHAIAAKASEWCRQQRTDRDVKEPIPRLLVVLEEAHTLIPEWNSNPVREHQDVVNKTAQIVLQARKYGLGFMVITQRTANVTKSILNQCNTIFAFQAYDETGFDFMKNYMGAHFVGALPNLKRRQGVLVGKASVSDRPVIVRFHDQTRELAPNLPRDFSIPAAPVVVPAPAPARPEA